MNNILICNESEISLEVLYTLLASEGFNISTSEQKMFLHNRLQEEKTQLLLMGLEKPSGKEIRIIHDLRKETTIPIIIVSKNTDETTKIAALNAGADDYVTMPCNLLELLARIKSQVRRYTQLASVCENINSIYRVDDLEIDDVRRKVSVAGKEVKLTPIEYKILRLLVRERGKVLSINQIYESIWHMQAIGADNTIAVHIRHIREKIEFDPKDPKYLKVVWGTGYKVG